MAKGGDSGKDRTGRFKLKGKKEKGVDPELAKLLDALKTNPGDYRTRLKLASMYLMREQKERAVQQYILAGDALATEGFSTKAVAAYRQAINIDSGLVSVYEKLAILYHRLGLMKEVVAMYQKVIAIHERTGAIKQALDTLQKMVDLDPLNTHGREKLAERYYQEGYEDLAIAQFFKVAAIYKQRQQHDLIIDLYGRLIERGIQNSEIVNGVAEACKAVNRPEVFIDMHGRLAEEIRESTEVLDLLAGFQVDEGDIERAKESLQKIAAFYRLAEVRDQEAAVYRRILEIDPEDEEALAAVGPAGPEQELVAEEIEIEHVEDIEEVPAAEEKPAVIIDEPVGIGADMEARAEGAAEPEEEIEIILEEEAEERPKERPEDVIETVEEPAEVEPIEIADRAAKVSEGRRAVDLEVGDIFVEEVVEVAEPEVPELPQPENLSGKSEEEIAGFLEEGVGTLRRAGFESEIKDFLIGCKKLNPKALPVYNKLKSFYIERGQTHMAIDEMRTAAEIARDSGNLKQLRHYLEDMVAMAPEDAHVQAELEDLIIETEPENSLAIILGRAERALDESDPDAAIGWLDKVFAFDPSNMDALSLAKDVYLASGQDERAADELVKLAAIMIQRGDLDQAEGHLKDLIGIRPKDLEAHQQLAGLLERAGRRAELGPELLILVELHKAAGRLPEAENALNQLLELSPENLSARRKLIDIQLGLGKRAEACGGLLDLASDDLRAGRNADGIMAASRALELREDDRHAREMLRDLYIADSRLDDAVDQIEALVTMSETFEERETLLRGALELDKANRGILEQMVDLYLEAGRRDDALQGLFTMVELAVAAGEPGKAEGYLQRIVEQDADNVQARSALKGIYIAQGKADQAAKQLETISNLLIERGELRQAEAHLRELIDIAPKELEPHKRLAELLQKGDRREELAAEMLVLADIYSARNRASDAERALVGVLELTPDNFKARERIVEIQLKQNRKADASRGLLDLAETDLAEGRLDEGIERGRRALELRQHEKRARELLRDLFIAAERYDDAVEQIMTLAKVEREPDVRRALLQQALDLDSSNREVLESLSRLERQAGRKEEAAGHLFSLASLAGAAGELDRAESHLAEILGLDPKSIRAHQELKEIYLSRGQTDRAAGTLMTLARMARERDSEQARLYLTEVIELDDKLIEPHQMLAEIHHELGDEARVVQEWLAVAWLQAEAGDREAAIKTYEQVLDRAPDNDTAFSGYKELLISVGRADRAIEELLAAAGRVVESQPERARSMYEEVIELDENNILANRGLMNMLLASGERVEGVAIAFKLFDLLTEAGDADRAEATMRDVLVLEPDNEQAIVRLKGLYLESGRADEAVELLKAVMTRQLEAGEWDQARSAAEEILSVDRDNGAARQSLADICEREGDIPTALEHLDWIVSRALEAGDREAAEAKLRKVIELDPMQVEAHMQLKGIYLEAGRTDKVIAELFAYIEKQADEESRELALIEVLDHDPNNERAHRRLIEIYRAADRYDDMLPLYFRLAEIELGRGNKLAAEEQLSAVLEMDATNEQALTRIKDLHLELGETDKAVAEILSLYQVAFERDELDRAGELLDEVRKLDPANETVSRRAIDLYDKLGQAEALAEERFKLFGILADKGDSAGAEQVIRAVLEQDQENMRAHQALRQLFIDMGAPGRAVEEIESFAAPFIKRRENTMVRRLWGDLMEIDPKHRPTIWKLAALDVQEGDVDGSLARLDGLATLADEAGETDESAKALKQMLQIKPDHEPALDRLVGSYESSGHREQAVDAIVEFADSLHSAGDVDGALDKLEQAAGYEEGFEHALERKRELLLKVDRIDEAIEVAFRLADHAERGRDLDRVEELMRDVLSLDRSNEAARECLKRIYLETGQSRRAIEELFALASLARKTSRPQAYEDRLREILVHDGSNREALRSLADHLDDLGRKEEAVETLRSLAQGAAEAGLGSDVERALADIARLAPNDRGSRERLVDIYAESGRSDRAIEALFQLSNICEAAGDLGEAGSYCRRVLELDEGSIKAYQRLKLIASSREDIDGQIEACFALYSLALKAKDSRSAERQMRDAIQLSPEHRDAHANLKRLLIGRGANDEAIHEAFTLADIASRAGEVEAVRSEYLDVLKLDPANVRGLGLLAGLNEECGETDEAIDRLCRLADIYIDRGDADEAEAALRHAHGLDPSRVDTRIKLKDFYVNQNEITKAAIELFALADDSESRADVEQATSYLSEVVGLDGSNMEARRRLKAAYLSSGRKDEAIGELFAMVGSALAARKRKTAEGFLREIFSIDPGNREAKEKLAEIFVASSAADEQIDGLFNEAERMISVGDVMAAKGRLSEILAVDPENVEATARLNVLLSRPAAVVEAHAAKPALGEIFHEVDVAEFEEEAEISVDWGPEEDAVPDGAAEAAMQTLAEAGIVLETAEARPAAEPEPEVVQERPLFEEPAVEEEEPAERIDLFEEGKEEAAEAIEEPEIAEPGAPVYTLEQAKTAVAGGNFEQANKIFNKLMELDPDDEVIKAEYEEFRAVSGAPASTFNEIFDEFRRDVVEHTETSEDAETHYNLGIAYREMDLVEEAISEFKIALDDRRYRFLATVQLGQCEVQAERLGDAVSHFEKALYMEGADPDVLLDARYTLGQVYTELDEFDKALYVFNQIQSSNPNYRGVKEDIAKLEREMKKQARRKG